MGLIDGREKLVRSKHLVSSTDRWHAEDNALNDQEAPRT